MQREMGEILFRPSSRRILAALGDGGLTLAQLADALGVKKPTVLRAIQPLVAAGVVEAMEWDAPHGSLRAYRARPFSIHWSMIRGVHVRWASADDEGEELPMRWGLLHQIPPGTFRIDAMRVLQVVEGLPLRIRKNVAAILVFGSVSRGEAGPKSDLDLLFLLARHDDGAKEAILDRLAEPTHAFAHPVRPVFATLAAFVGQSSPLFGEAKESGIVILGDVDEPDPTGGLDFWRSLTRYKSTST